MMNAGLTASDIESIHAAANRSVGEFTSFHINQPYGLRSGVKLMEHQLAALNWMRNQEKSNNEEHSSGIGGVLADEPGLGKTLSTLGLLLVDRLENDDLPTLIVSPTPVIAAQWKDEIENFTGYRNHNGQFESDLIVIQYKGPPVPYEEEAAEKLVEQLKKSEIILTDLSVIRKEHHYLSAQESNRSKQTKFISPLYQTQWRRVIVDEVQDVEGQASAAASMLRALQTEFRWGISGTPIAKGLDALKGLSIFLGLEPYNDSQWWKENIELNRNATQEEKKSRVLILQNFAKSFIWRSRHCDIEKSIPPQYHSPPILIYSSQEEFVPLYPKIKSLSQMILTEVQQLNWNSTDQTPLSNNDLKQLLSNGKGTNDMCRSAVSVKLLQQTSSSNNGSTKRKKKKGKNSKATAAAAEKSTEKDNHDVDDDDGFSSINKFSTSRSRDIYLNHSHWRSLADRSATNVIAKLFSQIRFMNPPIKMIQNNNDDDYDDYDEMDDYVYEKQEFQEFDVRSFEILVRCYLMTKMFKQNKIHISDLLQFKMSFHLQKVWELRSYIKQAIREYNLTNDKNYMKNELIVVGDDDEVELFEMTDEISTTTKTMVANPAEITDIALSKLAHEQTVSFISLLMINYPHLRKKPLSIDHTNDDDGKKAKKVQKVQKNLPMIGLRAWRLIKEYAECSMAQETKMLIDSSLETSKLEVFYWQNKLQTISQSVNLCFFGDHHAPIPSPPPPSSFNSSPSNKNTKAARKLRRSESLKRSQSLKKHEYFHFTSAQLARKKGVQIGSSLMASNRLVAHMNTNVYGIGNYLSTLLQGDSSTSTSSTSSTSSSKCSINGILQELMANCQSYHCKKMKPKPNSGQIKVYKELNELAKYASRQSRSYSESDETIIAILSQFVNFKPNSFSTEDIDELVYEIIELLSSMTYWRQKAVKEVQPFLKKACQGWFDNPDHSIGDDIGCTSCLNGRGGGGGARLKSNRDSRATARLIQRGQLDAAQQLSSKCKLCRMVDATTKYKVHFENDLGKDNALIKMIDLIDQYTNASKHENASLHDVMRLLMNESRCLWQTSQNLRVFFEKCAQLRSTVYELQDSSAKFPITEALYLHNTPTSKYAANRYSQSSYDDSEDDNEDIEQGYSLMPIRLRLMGGGLMPITQKDIQELDGVLGFISYLEVAARIANVPLRRSLSNAENEIPTCLICGQTEDEDIKTCDWRVLLCSHVFCTSCALNEELKQKSLTSYSSSSSSQHSSAQGRSCPICSHSQPFDLSRAPMILVDDVKQVDDLMRDDEDDDDEGSVILDKKKDKKNVKNDEINSEIVENKFQFSKHGLQVGVQVARIVKGYGCIIGNITSCQYNKDDMIPIVSIEEKTRSWLAPVVNPNNKVIIVPTLFDKMTQNKLFDDSVIISSFLLQAPQTDATTTSDLLRPSNSIGQESHVLGRASIPSAVLATMIKPAAISRNHARIYWTYLKEDDVDNKELCLVIEDNDSLNGLYVNNVRVSKAVLRDGDEVVVGGGQSVKIGTPVLADWPEWAWKISVKAVAIKIAPPLPSKQPPLSKPCSSTSSSSTSLSSSSSPSSFFNSRRTDDMDELLEQVSLAKRLGGGTTHNFENRPVLGFGSKIDELVKVLRKLKETHPLEKSLVFSQWADALHLVQNALTINGISSLILTGGATAIETLGQFRRTASATLEAMNTAGVGPRQEGIIQVLLMPLKATNAGLSINEAKHVFLLDTGLNRGLEIQALARVRRINSTQSTTVHRFIMQGTIEEAIWELRGQVEQAHHDQADKQATLGKGEEEFDGQSSKPAVQDIKRSDVYNMLSRFHDLYQVNDGNKELQPLWRKKIVSSYSHFA